MSVATIAITTKSSTSVIPPRSATSRRLTSRTERSVMVISRLFSPTRAAALSLPGRGSPSPLRKLSITVPAAGKREKIRN